MIKERKLNWDILHKFVETVPFGLDKNIKKLGVDKKVREIVKIKSNNKCSICGVEGICGIGDDGKIDLHLHHIIPNGESIESNLTYLCKHCHKVVHILLFLEGKWRYINVNSIAPYS